MDIGELLRGWLNRRGLSQAAFAQSVGKSRSAIGLQVDGTNKPERASLALYCEKLGLDAAEAAQLYEACDTPLPRSILERLPAAESPP
jgi:transcriptional regulator with XRE-family HTH domain